MKQFKQVESTRRAYHQDQVLNSIHRSSLMVPEIPGTEVDISFLNHFLLKRNYPKVACRITAIDTAGQKIESRLYNVDKPIVYTITLTGMVNKPVSNYIVEFFAAENLFIPYPAVMINHRGKGYLNQVHAFNRIVNDIFEDDEINSHQVKESSVDMILTNDVDTFFLFSAGPLPCKGNFDIEIATKERTYKKSYELDLPRFGLQKISIKNMFTEIPNGITGIIKAQQPRQLLFYGRMLSGQTNKDGAFGANHSYYDSSTTEEYWEDLRPSGRFYPFFEKLFNVVKLYPIQSPSSLAFSIKLYSNKGVKIDEFEAGNLTSPSNQFLDININSIIAKNNINSNDVSTFAVEAKVASGKMPTRIGHQLVYGGGELDSSVAVSLFNPNVFTPTNKPSFNWGQLITGGEFDSFVGIVSDPIKNSEIKDHTFVVKFYGNEGQIAERDWTILSGTAKKFEVSKELKSELINIDINKPQYIWCTIESNNQGLNFYTVSYNKNTKHCSGEHGF